MFYRLQDLKEMFREGGYKVTFCDAHRPRRNEGFVDAFFKRKIFLVQLGLF
jgi:hypothetical protein